MAYVVMAYVVMAYVVMAYVVMAYVVMACEHSIASMRMQDARVRSAHGVPRPCCAGTHACMARVACVRA